MDVNSLMEVLKWPLVVIVIVLIFMIMFRQQIAGFINRIRGISPGGGIHTSDMPPQLSSEDGHLSAGELMDKLIRTLEADKLIRSLDSLVLREMEEIIKNELKASKLADSVEAIPILIRYLAVALLSCVFEYIYGQIWGSQLSILNHLNIRHDGETSDVIRSDFYIPASELYLDAFKIYQFEDYLNFLKSNNLIIEEGGRLKITSFGRDFLVYLVSTGKNMGKFF